MSELELLERPGTLSERERAVVKRLVSSLRAELADDLVAIWLYGSRARGERPGPESDVDLLVVTRSDGEQDWKRAYGLMYEAAKAEGASPVFFSLKVVSPEWIEERRAIRSFFIEEVDRDKLVLAGSG